MKGELMEVRDASARYASQMQLPVVPEGYKQSEVGVIPEEWDVRTIYDIADRSKSAFDDGDWVEAEHITSKGIRLIQTGNIGIGKYVEKSNKKYIYESSFEKLKCKELNVGDILICRLSEPAGRACLLPDIGENKVITSVDVTIFRPREEVADRRFLVQYFSTREWFDSVLNSVGGTTHKRISRGALGKLPVPFPNIAEQCAIATALSEVDALLEALDRLIAKKRDIKQATMQQLLTAQTRLPGFEGQWESCRLDEIAEIRSGGTPSTAKAEFWNGSLPWCTPTDITALRGSKYLSNTERNISAAGLRAGSAEVIPVRSIIMTTRATIGECAINTVPMTTNQGFKNLVPASIDCEYLYYLMTTQKERLTQLCAGSTFLEIGKKQLASFDVYLPSDIKEQRAIATLLSEMDAELESLQQRRTKTAALKQAMMQELLTGRTRLVELKESGARATDDARQPKGHNWAFNEAVVISTLSKHFGDERYPVGRKRYTKLSYLLHRHVEREAEGYLKKAAGPYNPQTKYGGPEKIAQQNHYIKRHKGPKGHSGFIAAENIAQAEGYFEKWYGSDTLQWLERFRFKKNDELELLATVDMAIEELRAVAREVDVSAVKDVIANDPEWKGKLERSAFSDTNIADAITQCEILFGGDDKARGRGPC